MSWKETSVLEERKKFANEMLKKEKPFKLLCKEYGISEKTGYKWKKRFMEQGYAGLNDQNRIPKNSPDKLDEDVVIRIIKLRTAHPYWGAKKLQVLYEKSYSAAYVPSISSIERVMDKAGLVKKRKIKKAKSDNNLFRQYIKANNPNDVWTVDFKGWWMSDREKCLPLTIRDAYSRYLLEIRLMESCDTESVKEVFKTCFKQYGLPKVIRSDNGPPFACSNGKLDLTRCSAWWISLGIIPDRTDLGSPGQNGSHERMHAAREIQGKIFGGIKANQIAIDEWRKEYNNIRPNEAISMKTPSEVYTKSDIIYEGDVDAIEYPIGFMQRKVLRNGRIIINGQGINLGFALQGYDIGLSLKDDAVYNVWFADHLIGEISIETYHFKPYNRLE